MGYACPIVVSAIIRESGLSLGRAYGVRLAVCDMHCWAVIIFRRFNLSLGIGPSQTASLYSSVSLSCMIDTCVSRMFSRARVYVLHVRIDVCLCACLRVICAI